MAKKFVDRDYADTFTVVPRKGRGEPIMRVITERDFRIGARTHVIDLDPVDVRVLRDELTAWLEGPA